MGDVICKIQDCRSYGTQNFIRIAIIYPTKIIQLPLFFIPITKAEVK